MEEFFFLMMPHGAPVKHLRWDNAGDTRDKLQNVCEKENITLEYITLHTPQLKIVIERMFAVIKEGALDMLLNGN